MKDSKLKWRRTSVLLGYCFFAFNLGWSQTGVFQGHLLGDEPVEGVAIKNNATGLYAISNAAGRFALTVKAGDTLHITSVQFEALDLVLSAMMLDQSDYPIILISKDIQLEEVVVGNLLSGRLSQDRSGVALVEPITAASQGIPAFTGIQLEIIPTTYQIYTITPLGINIDLEAAYKLHTGYYKKLKAKRLMEREDELVERLIAHFDGNLFTEEFQIPEEKIPDFILSVQKQQPLIALADNEQWNSILIAFRKYVATYLHEV